MSAMVTPRQLQISKCGYQTAVSTDNNVTIFAHLNHIPEPSPQNISMYSSTYIHLYSSQNTAVSTETRHWAGQPRIKVQCLGRGKSFSPKHPDWLLDLDLSNLLLSGYQGSFFRGKDVRT
jgi:hypothetical protein